LTRSCPSTDHGVVWRRGTHALIAKLLAFLCDCSKNHEGDERCRPCHRQWRAHDQDKEAPVIHFAGSYRESRPDWSNH
jgi:hypothetical protein